jgi:hypothetical protein
MSKPKALKKDHAKKLAPKSGPVLSDYNAQELRNVTRRLDFLETMSPAILVNKADSKEVRKVPDMKHPKVMRALTVGPYPGFRFHRAAPYKMLVSEYDNGMVSAANTANASVKTLTPFACTDAKAAATLFDEARCVGIRLGVLYGTVNSTDVPSAAVLAAAGAVAFDPSNATAYGGLEGLIDAQFVLGPINFAAVQSTAGPLPTGRELKMHCRIPPNVPSSTGSVIGSNWTNANDTGAICGYFKAYVEAAGAATKTYFKLFMTYEMEFAFRT